MGTNDIEDALVISMSALCDDQGNSERDRYCICILMFSSIDQPHINKRPHHHRLLVNIYGLELMTHRIYEQDTNNMNESMQTNTACL